MDFEMIHPGQLDRFVDQAQALIIDLRDPQEYRERHIRGAINIPYGQLSGCCLFPRDRCLILYCERGASSMSAAKELAAKGYQVKTVVGGFRAYRGKFTETY